MSKNEFVLNARNENEDDVLIFTERGEISPKEIWEGKDVWFEQAKRSREVWDSMPEENKEALERMVLSALERMHDRTPEWLPEGLVAEGGAYVDVHLRFLFTDIDKDIDRNEHATSFQIKAATESLKSELKDLD